MKKLLIAVLVAAALSLSFARVVSACILICELQPDHCGCLKN